ncbi:alginate O-acetyltransferase AlgF [Pseudomonas sp. EA_35y_Pfl2_R5]|uniref:alginate O-acetyltransferase AlgF n=1 Tax=Pseudomonas sp. EA_35y_Pfl2_R5 TaxID=3088690 RepID=UPI0030DC1758
MHRTTSTHWMLYACTLVLSLASFTATAGEGGLYAPTAPKGSAFIRGYNASNSELNFSVGNTKLDDIAPLASSDFSFLPAGSYSAQVGSNNLQVDLEAERFYTLVSQVGEPPKLVSEEPFDNKRKALLRVQNLSDSTLSLKTADGKPVVEGVAPDANGQREVNPVKVNLALFDGDRKVSDLKPVTLARGEVVCLYITGSGNALSPVWVKRPARTE